VADPDLLTRIDEAMESVESSRYGGHIQYREKERLFIAAARTLLPAAREEIARLRADMKHATRLERIYEEHELLSEIARLREQVRIAREAIERFLFRAHDGTELNVLVDALAALSATTEAKETR
jgi:hypothetical protein